MTAALRRQQLLHEMGIGAQWLLRTSDLADSTLADAEVKTGVEAEVKAEVEVDAVASLTWDALHAAVLERSGEFGSVLFGAGDQDADWLFIGLAPSAEDLAAAQPFAGATGALLDNMLRAMALQRGANTFFTQLIKCSIGPDSATDAGFDPALIAAQVTPWLPYLQRQIALIKPAIIVLFGHALGAALLQRDLASVQQPDSQVYSYLTVPTIVTYAPDHLLRQPEHKRQTWHDLRLALATLASTAF